ncbi:hypothetical protein C1I98_22500 [Spongiactinospora gelatinilytica]|uniref:FAD/NAD(P)-binding domain-containing protein n=1 Tax=Spongiactinospora gelatinilytica TaxID=2666298 RepID=A0A2W2GTN8_9ACTN|nr:FAD-dependent oxidoreductase [Spongiactinospora gelatinilytica]PZG40880.1 hypothetical protein C1I98_22500 [Spongiactinospora gelatinilytica]
MKIVVIGGGYAGMTAALRLGRRHDITVISEKDRFTQRIRLHEFVAGRSSVTIPLAELTQGTGIDVVAARVESIDLAAKQVRTADGREFGYDTLVYALGSHTDLSLPGTAEHTYAVERAAELRERLEGGAEKVVVVGGGLTGIELAAELAESYPGRRIELVARLPLGTVAPDPAGGHLAVPSCSCWPASLPGPGAGCRGLVPLLAAVVLSVAVEWV